MSEETNVPVQSESSPTPNTELQQPIQHIEGSNRRTAILVSVLLVAMVAVVATYAYTQGLFGNSSTKSSQTPTSNVSNQDELQTVEGSVNQMDSDMQDLDQTSTNLNNIDTSGDDTPSL